MTIMMPSMARATVEERWTAGRGVLRRALARIVGARSQSIERIAATYIAGLSNRQLAGLGLSDTDIASLRAGEPATGILARR